MTNMKATVGSAIGLTLLMLGSGASTMASEPSFASASDSTKGELMSKEGETYIIHKSGSLSKVNPDGSLSPTDHRIRQDGIFFTPEIDTPNTYILESSGISIQPGGIMAHPNGMRFKMISRGDGEMLRQFLYPDNTPLQPGESMELKDGTQIIQPEN
jgi:hypothetical protein